MIRPITFNIVNNNFTSNIEKQDFDNVRSSYVDYMSSSFKKEYKKQITNDVVNGLRYIQFQFSQSYKNDPIILDAIQAKDTYLAGMEENISSDLEFYNTSLESLNDLKNTLNKNNPFLNMENAPYCVKADKFFARKDSYIYFEQITQEDEKTKEIKTINVPTKVIFGAKVDENGFPIRASYFYDFNNETVYRKVVFSNNGLRAKKVAILNQNKTQNPYFKFAQTINKPMILTDVSQKNNGLLQSAYMSFIVLDQDNIPKGIKIYSEPDVMQDFDASLQMKYGFYIPFEIKSKATYYKPLSDDKNLVFEYKTFEKFQKHAYTQKAMVMFQDSSSDYAFIYKHPRNIGGTIVSDKKYCAKKN